MICVKLCCERFTCDSELSFVSVDNHTRPVDSGDDYHSAADLGEDVLAEVVSCGCVAVLSMTSSIYYYCDYAGGVAVSWVCRCVCAAVFADFRTEVVMEWACDGDTAVSFAGVLVCATVAFGYIVSYAVHSAGDMSPRGDMSPSSGRGWSPEGMLVETLVLSV